MNLRMKKDTFLSLCRDLRPLLLRKVTRFRRPVSVMKRVAVALWRLSGTAEYRTIAHLFGIGRSTAHQVTREVCNAIVELLFYSYIRLPTGRELEESIEGFENFCGLPQVAGAIDGTHIEIKAPLNTMKIMLIEKDFILFNCKQLLTLPCDSQMFLLDFLEVYMMHVYLVIVHCSSLLNVTVSFHQLIQNTYLELTYL